MNGMIEKLFPKRMIEKIKQKREEPDENKNKGLTLVELLVAIVILATVLTPVAEVFITSTQINSKARRELQANITANSVLESAIAFSLQTFDSKCRGNDFSKFTLLAQKGMDSSKYSSGVFSIAGNADVTTLVGEYKDNLKTYAYYINGIKQSKQVYDAVVVFTKNDYKDVSIENGTTKVISETSLSSKVSTYFKDYDIAVYVYKHGTDYSDEDVLSGKKGNALAYITGSKLDNGK